MSALALLAASKAPEYQWQRARLIFDPRGRGREGMLLWVRTGPPIPCQMVEQSLGAPEGMGYITSIERPCGRPVAVLREWVELLPEFSDDFVLEVQPEPK